MPDLRRPILAVLFCVVVAVQVRWAVSTIQVLVEPGNDPQLINSVYGALYLKDAEAKRLGAQPKDQLAAINGQPVSTRADVYREVMRAPLGQNQLTVARGSERVLVPYKVTPREGPDSGGNFWGGLLTIALNIVIPAICILLGFFVAWQRPKELRAWVLLITLLGWSQFVHSNDWARWGWSGELRAAAFLLQSLLGAVWPTAWLWFCVDFPDRRSRPSVFHFARLAFVVPAFLVGLLTASWSVWLATHASNPPWQFLFDYLPPGTSNLLSYAPISLSFAALFHRFFREKNPDQRRRLRLFLTGVMLGLMPMALMLLYTFFADKTLDDIPQPILIPGLLMFAFLPLTLAYVVLVERAMDVGVVLREGLQYALATRGVQAIRTLIIAGMLFYAFLIGGDAALNRPQRLTRFSLAIAGAFLLSRAFVPLLAWVDRRFFRESVDSDRILSELHSNVMGIVDQRQLLETVALRVSQALHVPCVAALVPVNGHYVAAHAIGCSAEAMFAQESYTVQQVGTGVQTIRELRLLAPAAELAALQTLSTELLLPLASQDRLLGILSLGPKRSEEPYSSSDLRLLESVANHTGLALENSRLTMAVAQEAAQRERIHREIEIAREVQERLLPRGGPRVAGLDYAGQCRPALTIGGDYFDYIETPTGEVGFALGDIAGKGVPAALLMASLQASLRGLTAGGMGDLRELMGKLNALVYDATPKNRFATFVYVLYDAATRRVRLCSAGHNASLLVRAGQPVEWIRPPGIALGLMRKAAYEQVEFTLAPGDRLILYTDGVTEARDAAGEEYGEARLAELAFGFADLPAAESLRAVIADVDRFAGSTPQHDDLTAVVLRAV